MATVVVNRCKMTVTGTPGASGNITLSGASSGFQTLANALSERSLADGVTLSYVIEEGTSWQECTGVSSGSSLTLSRTNGWSSAGNTTGIAFTSAATVMFIAAASDMGMKANVQTFNSSGTWTKPSGMGANAMAFIEAWGAGGSGSKSTATAGTGGTGGGGGGYNSRWVPLSSLGSTETVTVGAGGAAQASSNTSGNNGGGSSFGAWLAAYGGAGGIASISGGAGGGPMSAASGQTPGNPLISVGWDATNSIENYQGGVNSVTNIGYDGWMHGGAGGTVSLSAVAGGASQYGGGGGGNASAVAGGTSVAGGAGGAANTAGTQPGGGGGGTSSGTSGAGGAGRIRITIIDGN